MYDGAKRRAVKKTYNAGTLGETRHFYYTDPQKWQVIEERLESSGSISANPDRQFVWGLRYIDEFVLRDRDTDANGNLDERLYALQDANWNVTGLADSGGAVQERYVYSAYGTPHVLTPTFAARTTNSYDAEVVYGGYRYELATGLYHVRHRVYQPELGCWLQRDPLGYTSGDENPYRYVSGAPINTGDPTGLEQCNITIYGGHNYNVLNAIKKDYGIPEDATEWSLPPTDFVMGIGCAVPNEDGSTTPLSSYLQRKTPCNTFYVDRTQNVTNPLQGIIPRTACTFMQKALAAARQASDRLLQGMPADDRAAKAGCCPPRCDSVMIYVKCAPVMSNLFKDGTWRKLNGQLTVIPAQFWEKCHGLCGTFEAMGKGVSRG